MSTALDRLRAGDLQGSLEALQAEIRADPSKAELRIFLFQLLCTLGDWNKAMTQLRLCAQLDAAALPMAQTYREAIGCEFVRARVFRGETAPLVVGEPQQWLALLVQALGPTARGEHGAAAALRDRAFEAAPATPGRVNDISFDWIADADMRLGPVLEVIMSGKYYWAPFNTIREVRIEEPTDLRDRVWTPAEIVWAAGGETAALIPTRYPGAEALDSDQLRLANGTRWEEIAEGVFVGHGQRVLATDADEINLMDVRAIRLESGDAAAPVEGAGAESAGAEAAAAEPGDG